MDNKPYHHGELRKALMETGIAYIGKHGEEKLSLRKIAEQCGVSNAAPYAHFKDKDDFIHAIQKYVMDAFMDSLIACVNACRNEQQLLLDLGVGYVMFFHDHPLYFDFLFSQKNIRIRLSSDNNDPPFELFRKTAQRVLGEMGMPAQDIRYKTIAMWSLVHGLAALSAIPDMDVDWEKEVREIIRSVDISCTSERER